MINEIKDQLKHLPKEVIVDIKEYNSIWKEPYIAIKLYLSEQTIHNVRGQYPQMVSLSLNLKEMELQPQVFGGNGGGRIYREIDPTHPREKYLAMVGVKIPFRKPKKEKEFVLRAIKKFADNYINTLRENYDTLRYKDMVDYSFLLK